jgi:hypothetical protein
MIELFTAATPNGWKASITLEELAIRSSIMATAASRYSSRAR